jgi:hypothetical protein
MQLIAVIFFSTASLPATFGTTSMYRDFGGSHLDLYYAYYSMTLQYTVFSLFRTENCEVFCVFHSVFFPPRSRNVLKLKSILVLYIQQYFNLPSTVI